MVFTNLNTEFSLDTLQPDALIPFYLCFQYFLSHVRAKCVVNTICWVFVIYRI